MNKEFKTFLSWWKIRGVDENDPYAKFFFFYIYLDAFMTRGSKAYSDVKKLEWLIETPNHFRLMWEEVQSDRLTSLLNGLRRESPILDPRNGEGNEVPVYLNDITDFGEVIAFIYQIRCNLFHGGKSWTEVRDRSLVDDASKVLEKWIVWAHLKL